MDRPEPSSAVRRRCYRRGRLAPHQKVYLGVEVASMLYNTSQQRGCKHRRFPMPQQTQTPTVVIPTTSQRRGFRTACSRYAARTRRHAPTSAWRHVATLVHSLRGRWGGMPCNAAGRVGTLWEGHAVPAPCASGARYELIGSGSRERSPRVRAKTKRVCERVLRGYWRVEEVMERE